MWLSDIVIPAHPVGHVSFQARILILTLGVALCTWILTKIRNRKLLIPTSTLLLAAAAGVIIFTAVPTAFDQIAYMVGIYYPPVLYLLLAILGLAVLVLHFAARLSVVDERSRKLAQTVTLLEASLRATNESIGAK